LNFSLILYTLEILIYISLLLSPFTAYNFGVFNVTYYHNKLKVVMEIMACTILHFLKVKGIVPYIILAPVPYHAEH